MAYVINPNGKDVWLRDNADTMDISPVTDASSVYLTNGRSVEQELSGTLKSEVVTVDSAMEKIVEGTLDGAYQECVLKGQTLVNLIEENNKEFQLNATGMRSVKFAHPLVDGKKYFVNWDVKNYTLPNYEYRLLRTSDGKRSGTRVNTHPIVLTGDSNGYDAIEFVGSASAIQSGQNVTIANLIVLEHQDGMENWGIPYFEGMQSVKMPVLTTTGKNLFNIEDFLELEKHTDFTTFGSGYNRSFVINGEPNTTYVISRETNEQFTDVPLSILNSDGLRQAFTNVAQRTRQIITTSDGKVYLSLQNVTQEKLYSLNEKVKQIQVEIGTVSTATSYEPYKTNILSTPQDMTLHKVNNICDTYNAITGEYTQYIGERVYQVGDETDVDVITDMTKTLYVLDNPITTIVEPNIVPFAYENGSVSLDSANGILPTLEYATTISRMGQVSSNGLIIRKHEQQITNLEKMLIQGIVNMNYNNALLNLDLKL